MSSYGFAQLETDRDQEEHHEMTAPSTQNLDPTTGREVQAATLLLPMVYDELCRLARARVARVSTAETLTPTELVHEAYMRLTGGRCTRFEGRRHFFFAAARAMRDILVEKARQRASLKHGGATLKVSLDGLQIAVTTVRPDLVDLAHTLDRLERECPEHAQVVMLSYFGGLTHAEIGEKLGISRATVERRWAQARAWLRCELTSGRAA